ncbi:hypothetical protein PENDEC_c047G04043, partial [Penicillium decumbens]
MANQQPSMANQPPFIANQPPTQTQQPRRTWEDILKKTVTNQAAKLPKPTEFSLWKWETRLTNTADFEAWRESAYSALKARRLHNLIDYNIPRPDPDEAETDEAQNWLQVSTLVQQWLESGVSDAIRLKIRHSGKNVELADAWMREATTLLQGEGAWFYCEQAKAFDSIDFKDYTSPKDYIEAKVDALNKLHARGIKWVHPFYVLTKMLSELNRPPYTLTASNTIDRISNLSSDEALAFGLDDLHRECAKIVRQLANINTGDEEWSTVASSSSSANPPPSDNRRDRRGQGSSPPDKTKIKKNPPPGVKAHEHAENMKKSPDEQGKCGYCGRRHPRRNKSGPQAATCWHINPELRPKDWNPPQNNDVWWWNKTSRNPGNQPNQPNNNDTQKPAANPPSDSTKFTQQNPQPM